MSEWNHCAHLYHAIKHGFIMLLYHCDAVQPNNYACSAYIPLIMPAMHTLMHFVVSWNRLDFYSSYLMHHLAAIVLTHCGLMVPNGDTDQPDSTKPLPVPTSTYHQCGPETFIHGHYLKKIWRYPTINW